MDRFQWEKNEWEYPKPQKKFFGGPNISFQLIELEWSAVIRINWWDASINGYLFRYQGLWVVEKLLTVFFSVSGYKSNKEVIEGDLCSKIATRTECETQGSYTYQKKNLLKC